MSSCVRNLPESNSEIHDDDGGGENDDVEMIELWGVDDLVQS